MEKIEAGRVTKACWTLYDKKERGSTAAELEAVKPFFESVKARFNSGPSACIEFWAPQTVRRYNSAFKFRSCYILKVATCDAAAGLIFTYKAGKRQNIERVTMQEVNELSSARRLEMISGRDIFALDDNELSLNLGTNSYYRIEPIMIEK